LVETLHNFEYQLEAEQSQLSPATVAQVSPQTATTPPEQGLYLDEKGHVWIDGEPLTPPLSKQEFQLLQMLYQQAPEIVPHEALIEEVWPTSAWMSDQDEQEPSSMDEQNLRKLVGRLRQRLPGKRSQYVKNVRGRGYWLKVG
jgi:DNA-binding winged helix-turn-helix (wHTH) protein